MSKEVSDVIPAPFVGKVLGMILDPVSKEVYT